MPAASKSRRLIFLIVLYMGLPSAAVVIFLVGWMVAIENSTLVLQSADSPDGRYRAEVVREDPGASSNYEFMVRVMPSGLTPLAKSLKVLPFGPVYVALNAHRQPETLVVRWSDARELRIDCRGCDGAQTGKPAWRDLRLVYELH